MNLPQEDLRDPGAGATDEEAVTPDDGNRTWVLVSGAVLALVGLVAPWMLRRSRDRRARASVDRQLARCWNQALEALEVVGVPRSAERTPFEAAALTAERFPIAARPISSLAAPLREKLLVRVKELMTEPIRDEVRLEEEIAYIADRTDVSEECTRFRSHLDQYAETLKRKEPVGKRLNFILQEMNREVNTIGSKCSDIAISSIVIQLKEEIEKLREQVQNVE